jgi:hypothetical protein
MTPHRASQWIGLMIPCTDLEDLPRSGVEFIAENGGTVGATEANGRPS